MNKTKIEWCDFSWNPVTGCLHGCPYCYARGIARRFGKTEPAQNFEPEFREDRLNQPLRMRKAKRIFVCSMADLMGGWVPAKWIQRVISVVEQAPHHTFQFLTKNPRRYGEFSWPRNAWLGVTTVNQAAMISAYEPMAKIRPNITFVSVEPMLGPVRLGGWRPDWVIIGAQTGHGRKQPEQAWVQDLTDDARSCELPVFYKSNLVWPDPPREFPRCEVSDGL